MEIKYNMKKTIAIIVIILALLYIAFDKYSDFSTDKVHLAKQDSLVHAVDSLNAELVKDSLIIDLMEAEDLVLWNKIEYARKNVKVITKWVDSSKAAIDTYTEHELITSFNTKYPADTITNPLPLAQPVLVAVAKDLVELDGAKQQLIVKDTIINLAEMRIIVKDSIIGKYVSKENTYKGIVKNQEIQINDWKNQYDKLMIDNKKLKVKGKIGAIKSVIVGVAAGVALGIIAN
jgi:hypothetical protein